MGINFTGNVFLFYNKLTSLATIPTGSTALKETNSTFKFQRCLLNSQIKMKELINLMTTEKSKLCNMWYSATQGTAGNTTV